MLNITDQSKYVECKEKQCTQNMLVKTILWHAFTVTNIYFPFAFSQNLGKFRVSDEGFTNRYRNREQFAPHTDRIYMVMYPGNNNADYTHDPNQVNRRQNVQSSRYKAREKVNGKFDMKVYLETLPALTD